VYVTKERFKVTCVRMRSPKYVCVEKILVGVVGLTQQIAGGNGASDVFGCI